jgi:hypothetical protein
MKTILKKIRKLFQRNLFVNVVLLFSTVFLTLIALEGFLRFFYPLAPEFSHQKTPSLYHLFHRPSATPGLLYELVPNKRGIETFVPMEINRYGMRDDDPIRDATAPIRRIAVIGDSFCFGAGIPVEEVFPIRLENYLNEMKPENDPYLYDVMNFGVISYSIKDELQVLQYKVLPWNPDLIIWAYVMNDPAVHPTAPIQLFFYKPKWWEKFQLYHLMMQWRSKWRYDRLGCTSYFEFIHHPQAPPWQNIVSGFQQIEKITGQENLPVLLMMFPDIPQKEWEDYPYEWIHRQVLQEGQERGFETLDLLKYFKKFPPDKLRYSKKDFHPSSFGHAVTAATLFLRLSERWWDGQYSVEGGQERLMSRQPIDSFENQMEAEHEIQSASSQVSGEVPFENE